MSVQTFQSFSPPEYQKRRIAEEAVVLLEERLEHFCAWLEEKGIVIWKVPLACRGDSTVYGSIDEGHNPNYHVLVEEYVNT